MEANGTEASSEEVTQPTLRAKRGPGKSASTLSAPRTLDEGMNGPPGTPSAPLEEVLVKPAGRWDSMFHLKWDSMYDDFYHQILPEGSQARNFDLTIPKEAIDLSLWGGQKVVSLEQWFSKEAMDKLNGIHSGLKAEMKAKNIRKYRKEWDLWVTQLEFLRLPSKFVIEVQNGIDEAADFVGKPMARSLKRIREGLSCIEGKLKKLCGELWKEMKKRLSWPAFGDPWMALKAKKMLLAYMHNYLLMKKYGEYMDAMKG